MTPAAKSLFQAIAFARIAAVIPNIPDPLVSPVKGALMALMLPGVHLLTLVSVLDEALAECIDLNNIPWPIKTKRDLFNRIEVVSAVVVGIGSADLQRVREMRNTVAHPGDANALQRVTWATLNEAVDIILKAFLALGQIGAVPTIVVFYEREPTLYPDKLGPNGERMRHKHRVGAKLNDEVFLEYTYEIAYSPQPLLNTNVRPHMLPFQGFAPLQSPADLLSKLAHDMERLRKDPNDTYAAFDFFVTAEHMVDWRFPDTPGTSQSALRKARRESSQLLRITSHLANGAKHFQALARQHDSVADLKEQHGGFDPRAFSPRAFSPAAFKMHGLNVHLEDGRVLHVLTLAEDVLSYWKTELHPQ